MFAYSSDMHQYCISQNSFYIVMALVRHGPITDPADIWHREIDACVCDQFHKHGNE